MHVVAEVFVLFFSFSFFLERNFKLAHAPKGCSDMMDKFLGLWRRQDVQLTRTQIPFRSRTVFSAGAAMTSFLNPRFEMRRRRMRILLDYFRHNDSGLYKKI